MPPLRGSRRTFEAMHLPLVVRVGLVGCGLLWGMLLAGCAGKPKAPVTRHYKNIVILADLGQRLSLYDQPQRDRLIINTLFDQFEKAARQHQFIHSKDKLHVVALPNHHLNPVLTSLQNALMLDMENVPLNERSKYIRDTKKGFLQALDSLYAGAGHSNQQGHSQLWTFFSGSLSSYLKTDTSFDNYVIVLTNGYADGAGDAQHGYTASTSLMQAARQQANWQSFVTRQPLKPVSLNTPRVHLFFAEIAADTAFENFPDELKLLQQVWQVWAAALNIGGDIKILPRITAANVCNEVAQFIGQAPVRRTPPVQAMPQAQPAPMQAQGETYSQPVVQNKPPLSEPTGARKPVAPVAAPPKPASKPVAKPASKPATDKGTYSIRQDF
jgi:hypothetical protein